MHVSVSLSAACWQDWTTFLSHQAIWQLRTVTAESKHRLLLMRELFMPGTRLNSWTQDYDCVSLVTIRVSIDAEPVSAAGRAVCMQLAPIPQRFNNGLLKLVAYTGRCVWTVQKLFRNKLSPLSFSDFVWNSYFYSVPNLNFMRVNALNSRLSSVQW